MPEVANFGEADLMVRWPGGEHFPSLGPEPLEDREPGGFNFLLVIGIDRAAGVDMHVATGQSQGEAPREGVLW